MKTIKVPDDVATNPIIIGHEFCGDILAVGKVAAQIPAGSALCDSGQPATPRPPDCPGYLPWVGGEATLMWLFPTRSWNKIACWHTTAKPILKARWLNRFPA